MIEYFTELDSTNAYCLRESTDLADGTMVVALAQTAGRGRRGRIWASPPDVNFYGSLVVKPPFGKTSLERLPQLAGLAVTDVMPSFGINDAWIKWPNDVFVGTAKICGVLAECVQDAGSEVLVIGIGVNLNANSKLLDAIDKPATSIMVETGRRVELETFADTLYERLTHWRKIAAVDPDTIHKEWINRIPLINKMVTVVTPSIEIEGRVKNILNDGSILITKNDGTEECFVSGDVSLKI